MDAKTKNWIVYGFQLQFFCILSIIIIFFELVRLFEVIFPPNFSVQEIVFSVSLITFMILNLGIASFSMYAFIFVLHILESNQGARTLPVCALAIDCALINLFFYHFFFFKEQYFTYFAPYFPLSICFHIPNLISQISEIFMIISFFTIFLNLEFGIDGINKSRIIKSNKMTDLIHILMIINGVLAILFLYIYTYILTINLIGLIFSVIIALFLIGIFNFVLFKKQLGYPLEAIARWRYERAISKNEKEEIN